MKRLAGLLVFTLLAAPAVEAARVKLPKPIDSPVVRPKVRDDHKPGKRAGDHPARYERIEWGAEWDRTLDVKRPKKFPSFLTPQD
jgi:hypothetical protein